MMEGAVDKYELHIFDASSYSASKPLEPPPVYHEALSVSVAAALFIDSKLTRRFEALTVGGNRLREPDLFPVVAESRRPRVPRWDSIEAIAMSINKTNN